MIRETKLRIQKYLIYTFLMLIMYVFQTTPNFLSFFSAKPLLVLPLAISIAMLDGELAGGLFGLFAGILCDTSAITIFGINSLIYMSACLLIGLLVIYYMQPSKLNSLIFTGIVLSFRELFEYFFYYVMWDYENISLVLLHNMLPMIVVTLIFTIPIFCLVRKIHTIYRQKLSNR